MDNDRRETHILWDTKVTRRCVDPVTFSIQVDVVGMPRIEESSYETTDFAISRPLLPLRHDDKSISTTTSSTGKKNGRKPPTRNTQQQRRFASFPDNQGTASSNNVDKSKSCRAKKLLTTKRPSKTTSDTTLGAFLQRNTLQNIIEQEAARILLGTRASLDNRSIGSKSMASMSVTDRSHAERSKTEESLSQRAKERIAARARAAEAAGQPYRNQHTHLHQENHAVAMQPIDETSISDFNHITSSDGGRKATIISGRPRKKDNLGGFLSRLEAIPEPMENGKARDVHDAAPVVSASTLRSQPLSVLSKAEPSVSGKKLRDERKTAVEDVLLEEEEVGANLASITVETSVASTDSASVSSNNQLTEEEDEDKRLDDSLKLEDAVIRHLEKKVRFRDEHSQKYISQELTYSMYDELFYTAEELAEFRYEAFMEEVGLDRNEFD